MHKHLARLITFLLGLSLLVFSGCGKHHTAVHTEPHSTSNFIAEEAPTYQQLLKHPKIKGDRNRVDIHTGLIHLAKHVPSVTQLEESYAVEFELGAVDDAANIVVTDWLPEGTKYIESTPPAKVEGKKITWEVDFMKQGEVRTIKLVLMPTTLGELNTATTVRADPAGFVATWSGKASVTADVEGPEVVMVGDRVSYTIHVKNNGTLPAENIIVTNPVPMGLTHSSGKRELTFNIGTLKAGEEKSFNLSYRAEERRQIMQEVFVSTSNAGTAKNFTETAVRQSMIRVDKHGTKDQLVGKPAVYRIAISNTGDMDLTNVRVMDQLPKGTRLISAEGASVAGSSVSWELDKLPQGETVTYEFTLTSENVGTQFNYVTVNSDQGVQDAFEIVTNWEGHPALVIEAVDTQDPLLVGGTTLYRIRVGNQGSAADSNVRIAAVFSGQVVPVTAAGATSSIITGQEVIFSPIESLEAQQTVEYSIQAKAVDMGDARIRIELSSDLLDRPVTEEESTYVY